jgi:drug/metabolite transporter (DMT)-like permease
MTAPSRSAVFRATVFVAISACCFGSISPLTQVALENGAALQAIQAWRYITTSILLVLYAAWRPGATRATAETNEIRVAPWYAPRILLLAGGGQASVATLALLSLRWLPTATTAFLFYTYPAWVAIITAVRGSEPLDRTRVAALVIALGGIVLMVGAPDAGTLHPVGVAVILAGALVYALYIPLLNSLQRGRSPMDVARAISVGGGLLFLSWALATDTLFAHFDARTLAASVAQGVLSAGAFLGFLAGLSQLGPVRAAITSTIEPFWTTVLALVLLGQPIGGGTLLGGAAIMAAVLLLQRPVVASTRLHSSPAHEGDRPGHPNP